MNKVKPFILSLLAMGQFYPHFFVNIKPVHPALNIRKMKFLNFLRKKMFYYHLLAAFILAIILTWLVFVILNSYTHHGEAIELDDYTGIRIDSIETLPNEHNFRYILTDSIYDSKREPGTIVMQNPLPKSKVKRNRKIYLTIVAKLPEMVPMPNLVDLSLRQSIVTLYAKGLQINKLQYIPDFAENAVLAQLYKGDTIAPDSLIQRGSKVDLILGKGYDPRKVEIPFLIGKTQKEAIDLLLRSSLNIGEEIFFGNKGEGTYRIYKQEPEWFFGSNLNYGDFINVWYRSDADFDFQEHIKKIYQDTLKTDPNSILSDSLTRSDIEQLPDSLFIDQQ